MIVEMKFDARLARSAAGIMALGSNNIGYLATALSADALWDIAASTSLLISYRRSGSALRGYSMI